MNRTTAQTLGDIVVIAIAVFFMASAAFDDMPARSVLNAVALFVIGSSLWRIWRRHRGQE